MLSVEGSDRTDRPNTDLSIKSTDSCHETHYGFYYLDFSLYFTDNSTNGCINHYEFMSVGFFKDISVHAHLLLTCAHATHIFNSVCVGHGSYRSVEVFKSGSKLKKNVMISLTCQRNLVS
jgi:hypothetical protein